MTGRMLCGVAAAAAWIASATQWGGVATAARNTKPQEVVVVGTKSPSTRAAKRKGALKRLRARPSNPKGGLLKQQGRPFIDADLNAGQ